MDWSLINWFNLSVLTASAFLSALIGSFIGRRNYALTAFLSAIVFAAIYIGWFGYLEQRLAQVDRPEAVQQTAPDTTPPSEIQQTAPVATPPKAGEEPSSTETDEEAQ